MDIVAVEIDYECLNCREVFKHKERVYGWIRCPRCKGPVEKRGEAIMHVKKLLAKELEKLRQLESEIKESISYSERNIKKDNETLVTIHEAIDEVNKALIIDEINKSNSNVSISSVIMLDGNQIGKSIIQDISKLSKEIPPL